MYIRENKEDIKSGLELNVKQRFKMKKVLRTLIRWQTIPNYMQTRQQLKYVIKKEFALAKGIKNKLKLLEKFLVLNVKSVFYFIARK